MKLWACTFWQWAVQMLKLGPELFELLNTKQRVGSMTPVNLWPECPGPRITSSVPPEKGPSAGAVP